jgi:hypothetical protein
VTELFELGRAGQMVLSLERPSNATFNSNAGYQRPELLPSCISAG